ncbi:MAG: family 43 glycosylhydrolase [Spirochaetaceae bacterium]|nr:family 43 glycosylhydrolase [Spirochaetaceae bacterium]
MKLLNVETNKINPLTCLDYPDPDVIRVGDVYFMITTTMHFMPGGEILRSYDLISWEHAAFVYETLEDLPSHRLEDGKGIYGKGMWAASLRHHEGTFYVCFAANDTHTTYLFTADTIEGPWKKKIINGFYHDCSLLFDDRRIFIAYGNTEIKITELNTALDGPKKGGLDRVAVRETGNTFLGYEGTHFYKINGQYYLFFIHSLPDRWRRVAACFSADSIDGEFTGGDVLNDDCGYCGQGVAQGGIVETPEGAWFGVFFQDHGAVGRIPMLVPMHWKERLPVFGENGKIPEDFPVVSTKDNYKYQSLTGSDDFRPGRFEDNSVQDLKSWWQWNHSPDTKLWRLESKGALVIKSGKVCRNVTQARNVLTQRALFPRCSVSVLVDGSKMKDGDYAGLAAFQSVYGLIALVREGNNFSVRMLHRENLDPGMMKLPDDTDYGKESARINLQSEELMTLEGPAVRLRMDFDFTEMKDTVEFFADIGGWRRIGESHKLYFKLDHFCGCRIALFLFSTKEAGGEACFTDFRYER